MREDFMKRIDARDDKVNNNKTQCDIASYPFGAEEMLLNNELRSIDRDEK